MEIKLIVLLIIAASCVTSIFVIFEYTGNLKITLKHPKISHGLFAENYQSSSTETDLENKECGYTKLRSDRYGSVLLDMIYAWSWAIQNNVIYIGAFGLPRNTDILLQLIRLLNLPFRVQINPFKNCTLLSTKDYKKHHLIQKNPLFNRSTAKNVKKNRSIVVHVRRGDVNMELEQNSDYYRYTPNSYFLNMINRIQRPKDHVVIFSQRKGSESFEDFVKAGYDVRLDTTEVQVWKAIIESDVFIMSKSTFSYVPALFTKGEVFYTEFRHKPLKHWNVNSKLWPTVYRANKILLSESLIPCRGGAFGAKTIQTHTCLISNETTIDFHTMPNIARTVYPCWSWFAEKRAINCAFLVTNNLSHKWFDFIAGRMGCMVVHHKPQTCAVLGILNKHSKGGVLGESYKWLSNTGDATTLQNITFRQTLNNKGLGIIKRKKDRRIKNIEEMNLTDDAVFFADMSYQNQAKWMNEHDIIIAAHGAELTNAIFIKRCTVVILLYPDHYYPNKYYESLIKESGGIPISWIKNKYLGSNTTAAAENDVMVMKDFTQHYRNRLYWRAKDINIDSASMKSLLQIGREKQQKCRNNKRIK